MAPAGIRDHSTCVLYIVNIVVFSGATAGVLVVGALADALETADSRSVARIAELSAISGLIATLTFIAVDVAWLGHFWHLFRNSRFTRPLIPDLMMITLYLGNTVALTYFAAGLNLARSLATTPSGARSYRRLALDPTILAVAWRRVRKDPPAILAPAAVLLYSSTAWVAGLLDATSGWETISIAALQYVSSLVFGLAVIIIAGIVSSTFLQFQIETNLFRRLGDVLAVLLPLLGYCLWAEMEAVILEREPLGSHLVREMTVGPYAPLFWFALIGGVVAPFVLLLRRIATPGVIGFAALLVILGVLVERWSVVILPLFGHAHAFYTAGGYVPTSSEVPSTLAAYVIVGLVYCCLGRRVLRTAA